MVEAAVVAEEVEDVAEAEAEDEDVEADLDVVEAVEVAEPARVVLS